MAYGPFDNLRNASGWTGQGFGQAAGWVLPTTHGSSAIYTSPANKDVELASIVLHNTHTAAVTVQVFVGGNSLLGNRVLSVTLAANDSFEFSPKIPLVLPGVTGGQGVWAIATTASKVNMWLIGREEV